MSSTNNVCRQDCKIRYCGQVECSCNKNEIVPHLSKKGITACPPGFVNEGVKIIGKGQGKDGIQNVYVRKCKRYQMYNDEDCCLGNLKNYNGCPKNLCPGTEKCNLVLAYYCINSTPKFWNRCRNWLYDQGDKTKIYVLDRICSKEFNWKTPACQAYFKRPNKYIFEYFGNPQGIPYVKIFILLFIIICILI